MLYTLTYPGLCVNHISVKLGGENGGKRNGVLWDSICLVWPFNVLVGGVELLCAVGLMLLCVC